MGTTTKPYMKVSERTKRFTERIYAAAHDGKLPSEMIEEERRRAEEERQRTEEERQRTEEERQRLEEAVVRLYTQFAMPVEQVAQAMGLSLEAAENILRKYGQN
jgi:transcription initiation factor TFIIIB Brf1 subunit/transcription initiation factor TFIIB